MAKPPKPLVAAAHSPREATDTPNGTRRSLSLSKGRTKRTSRRFDKLSDRMADPPGPRAVPTGQPHALPSLLLLVRGTRRTEEKGCTSLRLSKGRTRRTSRRVASRRVDKLNDRLAEAPGPRVASRSPLPTSLSLLLLVRGTGTDVEDGPHGSRSSRRSARCPHLLLRLRWTAAAAILSQADVESTDEAAWPIRRRCRRSAPLPPRDPLPFRRNT